MFNLLRPIQYRFLRYRRASKTIGTGLVFLFCFLTLFLVQAISCQAAPKNVSAQQLKAVYLFNFFHFLDCDTEESGIEHEKTITVLGDPPLIKNLQELNRSLLKRQKPAFRLKHINSFTELDTVPPCSILFISPQYHDQYQQLFSLLEGRPILTVSDTEDFIQHGGILSLVEREGKIRFKIDLIKARASGLQLGAQLLKTAVYVIR